MKTVSDDDLLYYVTYTVTKGTKNEALLWKIAVVGMGAGTFCPSPILVFYIPSSWKCLPAWRNAK
jgi:hypothetical protein